MGFDTQGRNTILGMAHQSVAAFITPMPSGTVELFGFREVSWFHREQRRLLKVMLPLLHDFCLENVLPLNQGTNYCADNYDH